MPFAARLPLLAAALMLAASPTQAATMHGGPGGHGPPDVRQLYICRVLPRYGGGFCTSPPYAPAGKRCSCEGPHGRRWGMVEHR